MPPNESLIIVTDRYILSVSVTYERFASRRLIDTGKECAGPVRVCYAAELRVNAGYF